MSGTRSIWARVRDRSRRELSKRLARREEEVTLERPTISFTFDDFPQSALRIGGEILKENGCRGTYYASLGLMGSDFETGRIFDADDLAALASAGHDLGCHTYSHCHSWNTSAGMFEEALISNRRRLEELLPGRRFRTMSYPISMPRPATKLRCAKYFACCRGGGQTFNAGVVDMNCLSAFFLEQSRDDFAAIQRVIDETCAATGWLIFATHDVCDAPTRYGCKPDFFARVVRASVESGARIATVEETLDCCDFAAN